MKPPRLLARLLLTLGAAFCGCEIALAAPVTFDTRQTFNAATGPLVVITFDDLVGGAVPTCLPPQPAVHPCVFALDDVTFVSTVGMPEIPQGPILTISPLQLGASNVIFSNAVSFQPDQFFASMSSTAIGFDLSSFTLDRIDSFEVVLTEFDGVTTSFNLFASLNQPAFFGAISSTGFSRVSFFSVPVGGFYSNFGIDNFAIQAVPEPSVVGLLGIGLIAILLARPHCSRRYDPS